MIDLPSLRVIAVSFVLSAAGSDAAVFPAGERRAEGRSYVVERSAFLKTPQPGQTPFAATYYTRNHGVDLLSVHMMLSRSDTFRNVVYRYSGDNGRTWSAPNEIWQVDRTTSRVVHRRLEKVGYLDPLTERFITVRIEAMLPDDNPLEGMRQWALHYTVSEDGGRSRIVDEPVVHSGTEYSADHPLPGVFRGRNCAMIGDYTAVPLTLNDGTIIVPIQLSPLGRDGTYENFGGGLTYSHAGVLRALWREDKRLDWELSTLVKVDPMKSTRGMIEPTIAQLPDGRMMMVMRGSNVKHSTAATAAPTMFGGKWIAWSQDNGRTWWEEAKPWTYTTGERFYSPSSCSQLLKHSSGRIFWIGNISDKNPIGNAPRYPLVIAELDVKSGLLRKDTVGVIDDRGAGESEHLSLSNFHAREDRETGAIVVNMSRQGLSGTPSQRDYTGDAFLYTITIPNEN